MKYHTSVLIGLLFGLFSYQLVAETSSITPDPIDRLSRQCLKIWSLMSTLIEYKQTIYHNGGDAVTDALDAILCRLVRVRDLILIVNKNRPLDTQKIEYIASSLDCIESYGYDLVAQYPGNWSSVIQEQIVRAQAACNDHILPLLTK